MKAFIIYQHKNMRKFPFGHTTDGKLAISELIRLTDFSAENKFTLEYSFIPMDSVKLKEVKS